MPEILKKKYRTSLCLDESLDPFVVVYAGIAMTMN